MRRFGLLGGMRVSRRTVFGPSRRRPLRGAREFGNKIVGTGFRIVRKGNRIPLQAARERSGEARPVYGTGGPCSPDEGRAKQSATPTTGRVGGVGGRAICTFPQPGFFWFVFLPAKKMNNILVIQGAVEGSGLQSLRLAFARHLPLHKGGFGAVRVVGKAEISGVFSAGASPRPTIFGPAPRRPLRGAGFSCFFFAAVVP